MGRISLNHVLIAAPPGCEEAARLFFGGLLGLDEIEKPQLLQGRGGVWFSLGEQQLHIGVDHSFSPSIKSHPALSMPIEDLNQLAETLASAGERVEWDTALPQVKRFFTTDPWGNRIELMSG